MNKSLKGKGARRRAPVPRRRRSAAAIAAAKKKEGGKAVFPYTWIKGKTGWSRGVVCHVDRPEILALLAVGTAPDNTIRGMWRLVASSTHGASVQVETGFTSAKTDTTTTKDKSSFSSAVAVSASVSIGVSVGDPAGTSKASVTGTVSVETTGSAGASSSTAQTAESTVQQSKTELIRVYCPDEEMSTKVTTGSATATAGSTSVTSHSSMSVEYVYQWVVGNADYEAKTQHFRCHRVTDGIQRDPQCPPQFCGNPFTNPYCIRFTGSQAGADSQCK